MRSSYDFSKMKPGSNPYLEHLLGVADANDVVKDAPDPAEIIVINDKVDPQTLRRLLKIFGEMVKYVVDVRREIIAIGGELHADAEAILLESGSRSYDLWGANYYPGKGPDDCIEYTSLINIRPALDNPDTEVLNPALRERMRDLTHRLIGRGEEV
jgi:hypothetical protein